MLVVLKRYEEALADLNRALALDPEYVFALSWRGEAYLLTGSHRDAAIDYDRAVQNMPDNDWLLYKQACAFKVANRKDEAAAGLRAAISIAQGRYEDDPRDWRNICNLALYHLLADETEAARYFYQEALAGEVLVHPNIVSDVIHDLDDFLVVFPNNADATTMRDLFETRDEP